MSYTRVNIAIKPPLDVQSLAIHLSELIAAETDAYFVLDNKNYYPHATIYSPEYPNKNLERVLREIDDVTKNLSPFLCEFERLSTHQGYIDLQLRKSQEWVHLHKLLVDTLNPFREDHLRDKYNDPNELLNYSDEQQGYIKEYGYAEVFNAFRPHITLSRIKDEHVAREIIKNIPTQSFTFKVQEIAAYTMGQHGTCTGILKEFIL
jgi:2'-5' RNA ligase